MSSLLNRSTTANCSREELNLMRQRMAERLAKQEDAEAAAALPPFPPRNGNEQRTSTSDVERAKHLKERIYEREVRPLSSPISEQTKDANPSLGLRAVYDVERVPTAGLGHARTLEPTEARGYTSGGFGGGISGGEHLLLAADSAALVRNLEDRLGAALQRCAVLEEDIDVERMSRETAETRLIVAEKNVAGLEARNDELTKQLEEVRKETRTAADEARAEAGAAATVTVSKIKNDISIELGKERDRTAQQRAEIKDLKTEKHHLDKLVAELKEQLSQNHRSLQTSTQAIRQLTNELLQAKQQSSFIANGYKRAEADMKNASALQQAQATELALLRPLAKEAEEQKELREKREEEYKEAKEELGKLKEYEKERKDVLEKSDRLGRELKDKTEKLEELRASLTDVNSRAHMAYQRSNRFVHNGPPGSHDMMMMMDDGYGPGGGGGSGAYNDKLLSEIRREAEEEEKKTLEATRQWRSRESTRQSQSARSYSGGRV